MYLKNDKESFRSILLPILFLLFASACEKDGDSKTDDEVVVISATGDINAQLNQFRNLVGQQLNTTPNAVGGRREINWDGVPPEFINKQLPPDFFNQVGDNVAASLQRGLVYESTGEFMVSNNNFNTVNADVATQSRSFSGSNSFANVSSSLWEVFPQKPGTKTAAKVQGFGIVFSDVDRSNSTFLEFFEGTESVGKFFVPARDNNSSFSFLGVYFKNKKVTKIRVGHDGALNNGQKDITNGGNHDLITLDDFIYSEPVID